MYVPDSSHFYRDTYKDIEIEGETTAVKKKIEVAF